MSNTTNVDLDLGVGLYFGLWTLESRGQSSHLGEAGREDWVPEGPKNIASSARRLDGRPCPEVTGELES